MTAQVAADLRAAAEVLRRDGWTQEVLVAGDGSCCAIGSIVKVTHFGPREMAARAALRAHIGANVAFWNDHPGRTADEVIAALEAAAERAEADSCDS